MLIYIGSAIVVAGIGCAFTYWLVKENSKPKSRFKHHTNNVQTH